MGDANSILSEAEARHLLRRTGFGAVRKDVQKIVRRRQTRGQAATSLLKFKPKKVKLDDEDIDAARDRWLLALVKTRLPLQEKLVLFWHDHFATAISKVENTGFMVEQNALLRANCKGNFRTFMKAMNVDRAMMEFLDTVRNRRQQPNENYGRELMELFTLGVKDLAGNDTYTQADIVQIARAFTGWRYNEDGPYLDEGRHDFMANYPERGPKTIFTTVGGFGPAGLSIAARGEGVAEIDTVIDILLAHTDSEGHNTVARRLAFRLFEYFAGPSPSTAAVDAVVANSGFAASWDINALLFAILVHDEFYKTSEPAPFSASAVKSVKWPIDYVVSTIRLLGLKVKIDRERGLRIEAGGRRTVRQHLVSMGQELFEPPSVFGWDWETSWLSSATLLSRYGFARDITAPPNEDEKPLARVEKLVDAKLTDPATIVDAVTEVLGIRDQLTAAERMALIDYLSDGGLTPVINLQDESVRDLKLRGLFTVVLQSPIYQLH